MSTMNASPATRMPAEERRGWAAIFEHYVFDAGRDAAAHIPANRRGALGEMTPELRERLRALLKERMR